MNQPLEDIRILDLTQVQSGPSCTQLLAWLGADVIKIEEPLQGDRSRNKTSDLTEGDSFDFLLFNANKKSVTLDIKNRTGQKLLEKLVTVSDVIVENFASGYMEGLNYGYEDLRTINNKIIYASIKGYGSYGPYSTFKSYEHIAQAMGGAISINGEKDMQPLGIPLGIADSGSGLHCAIGILAALYQRKKTGLGDFVEVSMQDSIVNLMRARLQETLVSTNAVERRGNRTWGKPSRIFPCRPGGPNDYVTIYIGGEAWDSLLAVIGQSHLIGDQGYSTVEARTVNANKIEDMITSWSSTLTKFEVMTILNDIGVPCGAVLSTNDVINDQHLRERGMIFEMSDDKRGSYLFIGCPIKMKSSAVEFNPPPSLGQHTEHILTNVLGVNANELGSLQNQNVI